MKFAYDPNVVYTSINISIFLLRVTFVSIKTLTKIHYMRAKTEAEKHI